MPIYEYRCGACGHELEALQKLSEPPLSDCPECSKPNATTGKKITLSNPAATKAAALAGRMACSCSPIVVAATTNGSVVACNKPAAASIP